MAGPLRLVPHPLASVGIRATWKLAPTPGGSALVDCQGLSVEVDPRRRKAIDQALYYHGTYEAGTIDVMRRVLSPGDQVVDVGAYTGFLAMSAARLVGSEGEVHAFEPHPDTRAALAANLERNDIRNVIAHPEALGSTEAEGWLSDHPDHAGADTLHDIGPATRHPVNIRPLDHFGLAPAFVKLDVEGWELEALRGAVGTLNRHRPVLSVEVSRVAAGDGGQGVVEFLTDLGYRLYVLAGG
ncbi:MAG: FkbM family methyltransferase [Actinomycetota bacterium]|nr:FkbM family methyltransferase [Actinomycetota bacterium]